MINLRKTYGTTVAVDDISFEVQEGEIFGMVGPNGAGKTTTIECLEGLRRPDSGSLRVLGVDPQQNSQMLRTLTGIQLQQSNLPDRMKVWEALDLYSSFYPHTADWDNPADSIGAGRETKYTLQQIIGWTKTAPVHRTGTPAGSTGSCSWMN